MSMAKGQNKKGPADSNIGHCRYKCDTRKSAVPAGIASYDTSKPKQFNS